MTNTKPNTRYSITATHRITGKSRTTIQKHLKKGKLSYTEDDNGVKQIDASELIRVYGDDCDFSRVEEGASTLKSQPPATAAVRTELHTLQDRLDTLTEERRREREQLQAQIDHLQDALQLAQEGGNRAILLLEDRSTGGEWRAAIAAIEARLNDQHNRDALRDVRQSQSDLLDQPWWRVIWGGKREGLKLPRRLRLRKVRPDSRHYGSVYAIGTPTQTWSNREASEVLDTDRNSTLVITAR